MRQFYLSIYLSIFGRNDPGPKRPRAESTHLPRPKRPTLKLGRNDPGPKRPGFNSGCMETYGKRKKALAWFLFLTPNVTLWSHFFKTCPSKGLYTWSDLHTCANFAYMQNLHTYANRSMCTHLLTYAKVGKFAPASD